MSDRHTIIRGLHDLGLAAWFGGSLMGAVGLNAAAGVVDDPKQRGRVANAGWDAWTPVNAAAIGAHLVGAVGLLAANRDRVLNQHGVGLSSAVKTALTGISLGLTAYSRVAGQKVSNAGDVPIESGTEPNSQTPTDVAKAQDQLRALQWAIPASTGLLLLVSALQGEQQRPDEQARGRLGKAGQRLSRHQSH
ncbi:MAG: hypothetical protein M3446_05395 [Actinomycetota bacterium]|jgi:hypothetical protein|nr:hypothetical protein [Actinomycetota bacterium]